MDMMKKLNYLKIIKKIIMLYNPKSEHDVKKARVRFEQLIEKGKPFELTDISKRSLKKNALLHVYLQYLALEMGWTLSYTKQRIWKARWCKEIFVIKRKSEKTGEQFTDIRSSADLKINKLKRLINDMNKSRLYDKKILDSYICNLEGMDESFRRIINDEIVDCLRYFNSCIALLKTISKCYILDKKGNILKLLLIK
jgi:hypothetical protein